MCLICYQDSLVKKKHWNIYANVCRVQHDQVKSSNFHNNHCHGIWPYRHMKFSTASHEHPHSNQSFLGRENIQYTLYYSIPLTVLLLKEWVNKR